MPDTFGSLIGRAAAAACLTCALVTPAAAQDPGPSPIVAPDTPAFMSRYDFHLSAASLSSGDQRFSWDTHFGGDMDIVDYVGGRVNILVDYEAMLGSAYRPFDPNQGNYTIEASGSARLGGTEIAAVFHHVSRHLSDRPKRFAVAYNSFGARVLRRFVVAGTTVDVRADGAAIVQKSYVDYQWTADLDLLIRRPINKVAGVYAHGAGGLYGIDASVSTRDRQRSGRIEAGVRLDGRAGAVELFAGYERRVDAYQLDLTPMQWGFAGFRLTR